MRYPLRPLWVVGLTWLAVCLIGAWLSIGWLWIAVAVTSVLFLVVLAFSRLRQFRTVLLILATLAVALGALIRYETVHVRRLEPYVEETVSLRARITEVEPMTVISVLEGDLPKGTRLYLWQEPIDAALKKYDIVEAEFTLKSTTDDGFERIAAKASGVLYGVIPIDTKGETWSIAVGKPTITERITDWRRVLAMQIQSLLDGDVGAVVTGVCFGVDERLSGEAVSAFRIGGVAHLFAVSGLHLSVLTGALLWLLRRLHLSRRVAAVVTMVAVTLFCLLMGGEPSVVRAGVLCLVVCGGVCLRREADARNSLGLALIVLLIAAPYAAYDLGLLLSFSSTCGLLFLAPFLRERLLRVPWKNSVWNAVSTAVSVTISAMIATLPIVLLFFGRLSIVGVLANTILTLPASVLLVLGWLSLIPLLLGWTVLYYPMVFLVGWLSRALLWIIKALVSLPFSSISFSRAYASAWLVGAVALVAVGYALFRRRGAWIALGCAAVILCTGVVLDNALQKDRITVRCFETSGDLAAYVTYEGRTLIVMSPTRTETLYSVAQAFSGEEIVSVEAVLLPTGEPREIGYAPIVLDDYAADAVFYRPSKAEIPLWDDGKASWDEQGLRLTLGDASIAFYETTDADVTVTVSGMTVYENGEAHIVASDGEYRPRIYIKDGELRIK